MYQKYADIQDVKILLVDDKPENLYSLETLLEETGRVFLKATSGNEALKIALTHEIALILLDVQMPEIDGFEVAKILKSSSKTKYIPIIFVTALSKDIGNILKGYREGGMDYLFKPLEPEITRAKVSSFIKMYKQQKELEQKDVTLENLGLLVSNTPDIMCIILTSPKLLIEEVNPAGKTLLGYEINELKGSDLMNFFFDEDKNDIIELCQSGNMEEGIIISHENKVKCKDGSFRWLTWSAVLKNKKWFANAKDITEQKLAEEALKTKSEELERSNKELEQFAYIASHDLQEPLRTITSYLQLLEKQTKSKLDKDSLEFLGFAVDGAKRMYVLIQDLLVYSRVTMKTKTPELIDCSIILQIVLDNLQESIHINKAIITADSLPKIKADKFQMIQLFQNIIGNAIKFHRENEISQVHVSVKKMAENGLKEWLFSVKDNGIGIAKEYEEKIFALFQRLHSRDKYEGTGIGLSVCKKIVEKHGGKIWMESELGKGTTFYFTLKSEE